MEEVPKKTQESYLQLHFIPFLHIDRIPLFEASIQIPKAVVWSRRKKRKQIRNRSSRFNYLQDLLIGKWTTGDSILRPLIRGGM